MISVHHKGNYEKLTGFLERAKELLRIGILDKYGKLGVSYLSSATPKDTGLTSSSWTYSIKHGKGTVSLIFSNSNIQNGVPIAVILQYGHCARDGSWVEGIDYINPVIRPMFEELVSEAWEEVRHV